MRTNERLFERVAPMGVNDIAMACQYKFEEAAKLDVPVTSFDGLADNTIDAGAPCLCCGHPAMHSKGACAMLKCAALLQRNCASRLSQTSCFGC